MAKYTDGLFSEFWNERKLQVSKNHVKLFLLSAELNSACHRLLSKGQVDPENGKSLIISCLFIRSLELYQATVLLLQSGMTNSAKIVLRGLLEVCFRMQDIFERDGAFQQYIGESVVLKNETVKKTKELFDSMGLEVDDDLDKISEGLSEKIKSNNWKKVSTYKVSEDAGMSDLYKSAYHILSKTVHAASSDIENHLHFDKSSVLSGFGYSDTKDVSHLLLSAMGFCADAAIIFSSASSSPQDCSEIRNIKLRIENSYED